MIFNIALFISMLVVGCLSILVIIPIKVKEITIRRLWKIFVIAFSVVLYFNEPMISTDLWRHYYCMDEIRDGIIPLMYGPQIGFDVFLWVLTIIGDNYLLPSVVFCITGIMIDKIYGVYLAENVKFASSRTLICYYMIALSGLSIFNIVSGIRTALVCVFFVWAYYKYYEKKRKIYYGIVIIIGTIHIISFMLLLLVAVNSMMNNTHRKYRLIISLIFIVVIIRLGIEYGAIAFISGYLPGEMGILIHTKIIMYGSVDKSNDIIQLTPVLNNIIIFAVILFSLSKGAKHNTLVYLFLFLGLFGGADETLEVRLIQAAALLMLPNLNVIFGKNNDMLNHSYGVVLLLLCLFSNFFSFYSFCAHTDLNGINYRDIIAAFLGF